MVIDKIGTILFFWCLASTAKAGWNSGGGLLFSDAANPWFVENTTQIRYCLEIDQTNFGQTLIVAQEKVRGAFAYWKEEFRHADYSGSTVKLNLATQDFIEVPCSQPVDIKFQLGTLTPEQEAYLQYPSKVISLAVRTDYDERALRGKGFVYVSPELGTLALTGHGSFGKLVTQRWQRENGKLLELTLIHELGHVFGIPHIGDDFLMAERAPMDFVSFPIGLAIRENAGNPRFFLRKELISKNFFLKESNNGTHRHWFKILGIPANSKRVEIRPAGRHIWKLLASSDEDRDFEEYGTIRPSNEGGVGSDHLVTVHLTHRQKVFPIDVPTEGGRALIYWISNRHFANYVFEPRVGNKRFLHIVERNNNLKITGVDPEGKIVTDFLDLTNYYLDWSGPYPHE